MCIVPSIVLVVHYVQTYIISWIQMWGREGVIMHRWQRHWLVSILFCMAMSCLQCTSLAAVGIDDSGRFIIPIDHIHLVDCLLCSECPAHLDSVHPPACCTREVESNVSNNLVYSSFLTEGTYYVGYCLLVFEYVAVNSYHLEVRSCWTSRTKSVMAATNNKLCPLSGVEWTVITTPHTERTSSRMSRMQYVCTTKCMHSMLYVC